MSVPYAVGIDLGGTTYAAGLFDSGGKLVDRVSHDTPHADNPHAVADALAATVRTQLGAQGKRLEGVPGLAIGFPGPVDPQAGVVKKAPNVPCLGGYPLTEELARRLDGIKVSLQNDAYCATLAELRWGAGKNVRNLVMLTLGTGIGGGVAINDEVIRGPRQILGEIGHMVLDPGGRRCGCGNCGCFEALAARDAIIEMAQRAIQTGKPTVLNDKVHGDQTALTPKVVTEAAEAGDGAAIEILERVGFIIGLALCTCIVLTDPDLIVIGGGIAAAGELLFEPIRRTVRARSLISGFEVDRIVPAQFGNLAGIYGAGALAWDRAR